MKRLFLLCGIAWASALLFVSCSQPDAEPGSDEASAETMLEEAGGIAAPTLDQLSDAVALRLERKLVRGISFVPGSLTLSRNVSAERPFGGFRATIRFVDETYEEVTPEKVIEELALPSDQEDAVRFALRGTTLVEATGVGGTERSAEGSFSAEWTESGWEVEDFTIETDIEPEGYLLSYYRGKNPLVLGSPELVDLVDRAKRQLAASETMLQTQSQREVARVEAMEQMHRIRAETGSKQGATEEPQ